MSGDALPPNDIGTDKHSPQEPARRNYGQLNLALEQVHLLYNGFPVSLLASLVIAVILSMSHWDIIAQREIILWNLLLGSILLMRLIMWISWRNLHQLYTPLFWLSIFRMGAWLTGCAWGSAAILLFAKENSIYQALLAFTLAGVATGSITSLTVDKYSSIGFVIFTISPLSIAIFLHNSPTAIAMSSMTLLFIFFVINSATRSRSNMEDQLNKQFELLHLTDALNKKQQQERIINSAQSIYITENNIEAALSTLLHDTLALCNSELGFIGQVNKNNQDEPFMRALVFASNKKNDTQLSQFSNSNLPPNGEYRNLGSIFGSIMQSGKPLISSNLARDLRAATLPSGHPAIGSFIGIPIFNGKEQIALLGLANAPEGYTLNIVEQLEPILKSIAQFVLTMHHEQQHQQDQAALEASTQHTQTILNDIADGIITINKDGIIASFNHAAETIFGYRASQIIGKNISELMPEPYKSMHDSYIKNHLKTNKKNIIGIGREVLGLRRNGNEFPMDLMVSRVYQNGEPIFIGIIRDITEKKRVDDLRTQFIAAASREILGPLNLISEAINILHSDNKNLPPEKMTHLVEIAKKNSSQLQKLMRDLIEMQNLSKSNAKLHFTPQAALLLIEETINENNIYSNIDLIKPLSNNLMIHTDARGFIQALGHLLQYLQKISTRNSKITVRIDEDKGQIKLTLRTTKKVIYDKHSSASEPRNNSSSHNEPLDPHYYVGDELGLEIAKEITEKMHGKIAQENTADEIIFVLHFPQSTHYS